MGSRARAPVFPHNDNAVNRGAYLPGCNLRAYAGVVCGLRNA